VNDFQHPSPLSTLPPERPLERLLDSSCGALRGVGRLLCNTVGRGQFAIAFAEANPGTQVTCFLRDLYDWQQCAPAQAPGLEWCCQSDVPPGPFDAVAFAFGQHGEAEWTREMLQAGYAALRDQGKMVVVSDNRNDRWLLAQMQLLFSRVERSVAEQGVSYQGCKTSDHVPRIRSFTAEFVFRDGDRLLRVRTRPGVFSHRRIDPGARALLRVMRVESGMRVLDLGCGSGVISLAAASRATHPLGESGPAQPTSTELATRSRTQVLALDSNPRAVECLEWSAKQNQIDCITVRLDCDGSAIAAPPAGAWYGPGRFDLVAVNPPYYSHFRIADRMLRTAELALRADGELLVVTKSPEWYLERLADSFREITFEPVKNYMVVRAWRLGSRGEPGHAAQPPI